MAPRLLSCFGKASAAKGDGKGATGDVSAEEQRRGGPVVVELFTSQGCVESTAAELLVSRLARGDFGLQIPVVVLAFHVDYWDYMGWKDPYASSLFTVRQKAYVEAFMLDAIFTPQIVIHGTSHCVGNDEDAMLSGIAAAPRYPAPTFQATFQRPSSDSLQVSLTGALRTKVDNGGVDVMVAVYQSGLVTDCPGGKNKGRVLSNDYVVRRLEKLLSVKDAPAKKILSGTVSFTVWEGFNSSKCGLAILVQDSSRRICGAQNLPFPDSI